MAAEKHGGIRGRSCHARQDTAEFRVDEVAAAPSGTVSGKLYQTGFRQESAVTVNSLPLTLVRLPEGSEGSYLASDRGVGWKQESSSAVRFVLLQLGLAPRSSLRGYFEPG